MAAAIPAGIGLGSSIIGGIQGKGAAKKQQKLAEQQLKQLQPLIDAQIKASQFGLSKGQQYFDPAAQMFQQSYDKSGGAYDTAMTDYTRLLNDALGKSNELYGSGKGLVSQGQGMLDESGNMMSSGSDLLTSALPYLTGAGSALNDLQSFYRPFMTDGARAIDRFLPSAQRVQEMMASEFGNVNQGYRSASENIAKFAPRGGGRISSLARADVDRQKGLSDLFTQGRQNLGNQALSAAFQSAGGQQNVANALQSLGLGQGQLGLSQTGMGLQKGQLGLGTIGAGTGLIGQGTSYLNTGGGLAQNAFGQGLSALGQQLNAGQGLGNMATSALGMGLSGGNQAYNLYGNQANRAYGSQPSSNNSSQALGGFLTDLFSKGSEWWKGRGSGGSNPGTNVVGGYGPQP